MKRTLEPELMDDPEQALAYAGADFEQENQGFVDRFREYFPEFTDGHVLDLGCGPGDIPIRLARALSACRIIAVDASGPMIRLADEAVKQAGLADRITFHCERFQAVSLVEPVDAAVSNSLLHHVPNPLQFWYRLRQLVKRDSPVLVMDLLRPDSPEEAQAIVDRYAAEESEILRRDFYRSLLASFTEDEVAAQLAEMNMSRLVIDVVDDRHWVVSGIIH
ncbi:MAG: methyltransferase domain-containing protein [Nitrospiraceae bacterium]|jgi:cyclopropane fatty-acyl-phospholipid synthase-like methyltransferase|nr:methyltransferase domain-containing protein [Nitrospiraceae bacterium]